MQVEGVHVGTVGEAVRQESTIPAVTVSRDEFDTLPGKRVSDIVSRLPGVDVSGPPGEKKSFSLRGLPIDYTRVSIDGLTVPGPSRTFELMGMSSFLAGDVTLVRNPSAEHEADGIAGRIDVATRPIPLAPEGELRVAYGGHREFDGSTRAVGGSYGQRFGAFGLQGALAYEENRITKIKDRSEFTFSGGPGNGGFIRDEEEPKDWRNIDASLDLAGFYDGGEIHLKPYLFRKTTDLDKRRDQWRRLTGVFHDRTLTAGREEAEQLGARLEHKHGFGNGVSLRSFVAGGSASNETSSRETTLNGALAFASASETESAYDERTYQGGTTVAVPLTLGVPQVLKAGVVVRWADRTSDGEVYTLDAAGTRSQTADNLLRSAESDYEISERYYAAFVQNELRFGDLTVTPGLRIEHVVNYLSGFSGDARVDTTDLFPSLPVRYALTESVILRGAVSRQINRPKFEDMAPGITRRGPRTIIGNPDVRPTRAWSFDAGSEYHGGNLFLAANAFYRKVRDVIEADEIAPNVRVVRNVGNGYAAGLELEQRIGFGIFGIDAMQPFSIFANQTLLRTRVDDPATGRRQFAETPDLIANIGAMWNDPRTGTVLSATYSTSTKRTSVSNEGNGNIRHKTRRPEPTLDLYAEQRIVDGFSLFGTVENVTNQVRDEFEVTNGVLSREAVIDTGRTFLLGGRFRF